MSLSDSKWHQIPAMNRPRRGCGVCELKGNLYVFGGSDNSIEKFDGDQWIFLDLYFPNLTTNIMVYPIEKHAVLIFGSYDDVHDTVWHVNVKTEMMSLMDTLPRQFKGTHIPVYHD